MNQELWIELYYKFRRAKEEKLFREYDKKKTIRFMKRDFVSRQILFEGKLQNTT